MSNTVNMKQIRDTSTEDLSLKITEAKKDLLKHRLNNPTSNFQAAVVRKEIARYKTVINERANNSSNKKNKGAS